MTPREARRARRETERKAKKAAFRRMKAEEQSVAAPVPVPRNEHQDEVELAPRPGHSTGPRTVTGKATSSRNSFKHGLASGQLIIPGENAAEYEATLDELLEEHQPANPTEDTLVHELARSHWLMQRAIAMQNSCFTTEGVDAKQLAVFLRYYTTYERSFHRALNALLRLKKERVRQFVSHSRPDSQDFVSQQVAKPPSERAIGLAFVSSEGEPDNFVSQQPPHAA
jgi:hypothetical protein